MNLLFDDDQVLTTVVCKSNAEYGEDCSSDDCDCGWDCLDCSGDGI